MLKLRTAERRRRSGGLGARGSTDLAARGSRAHGQSVLRSHRSARQGGRVAVANTRFDARQQRSSTERRRGLVLSAEQAALVDAAGRRTMGSGVGQRRATGSLSRLERRGSRRLYPHGSSHRRQADAGRAGQDGAPRLGSTSAGRKACRGSCSTHCRYGSSIAATTSTSSSRRSACCAGSTWSCGLTQPRIPLSDLGYSAGRWVGDTLEVRTTRVGWPYVDDDGRPQSTNVEILERFALGG